MGDDDEVLGPGRPKIFESDLFSTDANALAVLEGVKDTGLSDEDCKTDGLVESNGDGI